MAWQWKQIGALMIEPNILVSDYANLPCNNKGYLSLLAQTSIVSLSFWRSGHGSSEAVYHVSLLLEMASQFADYTDDTALFAWCSNT